MAKVYIGTSGWMYPHWKGEFYPENLPQKDWLRYYSNEYDTVEVNSSFYRQTKASTFAKWLTETLPAQAGPKNFIFSIKGNRFITHTKRLKDCKEPLKIFFENTNVLTDKRSKARHVILWQLPPSLKKDTKRLGDFLKLLPKEFRHAFEFRHSSWSFESVKSLMLPSTIPATVVLQDWKDWPMYTQPAGDFVYIRFHGKDKLYTSGYSKGVLDTWAKKMQEWKKAGLDIYAYFNNDALGYAVKNALRLKELTRSEYTNASE